MTCTPQHHWLVPFLTWLIPVLSITGLTIVRMFPPGRIRPLLTFGGRKLWAPPWVTGRFGWGISLANQVPFSLNNILLGAYPYLLLNAFWAWNALRGINEWKKEK